MSDSEDPSSEEETVNSPQKRKVTAKAPPAKKGKKAGKSPAAKQKKAPPQKPVVAPVKEEPEQETSSSDDEAEQAELTSDNFMQIAKSLEVSIQGKDYYAVPRVFKTGSYGWNLTAKHPTTLNGKALLLTVSGNFTIQGSKPKH